MDPVTAALNLATASVAFAEKIWDATPADLKQQEAANWAKFIIGIGDFITQNQPHIAKLAIR